MNPVDFEMAKRLSRIENEHAGKIAYLPPSIHLNCNGHVLYTRWWYEHAGFVHTEQLNYWKIPA